MEAIRSFRMAIECLNSVAAPCSSESNVADFVELPTQSVPLECLDMTTIINASPHNTFDIYQVAFCFPKVNDLVSFRTEISVILFYNLALTHQLAGLLGAEESQNHLRHAQKFYKLALTVFKSTPGLNIDMGCFALVLGMLTNMGHLFTHFWNPKDAAACRMHMQEILQSAAVMGLSDDDGEFFFSALAYSQSHDAVAAPAA